MKVSRVCLIIILACLVGVGFVIGRQHHALKTQDETITVQRDLIGQMADANIALKRSNRSLTEKTLTLRIQLDEYSMFETLATAEDEDAVAAINRQDEMSSFIRISLIGLARRHTAHQRLLQRLRTEMRR